MGALRKELEEKPKAERTWGKELGGSVGLRGVRENDEFVIDVFQDRKRAVRLNRTKYLLKTASVFEIDYVNSQINLPVFGNKESMFSIELINEDQSRNYNEKSRYLLKSLSEIPFRLNGIYCFEAFLERGDILDIGFNRIQFSRQRDKNDSSSLIRLPENIAKSSIPLLLEGETGTGKTTLARAIHDDSARPGRFVHLNLSAFSPSLIESELFGHVKGAFTGAVQSKRGAILEAQRGTLFLDEIDSLTWDLQTKLLLFLDDYQVRAVGGENSVKADVRLIFSSGSNLKMRVKMEKMRRDFYYRLQAGYSLFLDSLRNNPLRIKELCLLFEEENAVLVGDELIDFYSKCQWPGNIRQLKAHLLKKKILSNGKRFFMSDEDRFLLLDKDMMVEKNSAETITMETMKMNYCYEIYLRSDKNITKTAKTLEISPNTLKVYLQRRQKEFQEGLGDHDVFDIDLLN